MNTNKVDTIPFDEKTPLSKIDFSDKINKMYESFPDSAKKSVEFTLKIENY